MKTIPTRQGINPNLTDEFPEDANNSAAKNDTVPRTFAPVERPLDAYYFAHNKSYLIPRDGGGWVQVNQAGLKLALRECGLWDRPGAGELLSPIDQFTNEVHTKFVVDYAGPLAGYRYGLYPVNG